MNFRNCLGLAFIGVCAACSPSQEADALNQPTQGGGTGASSNGGSGSGGSGAGNSVGGAGGDNFNFGGVGPSPNGGGGGECAATTQTAEDIVVEVPVEITTYEPIALFVMLDRSSSMVGVLGDPNSWPTASNALSSFANDPLSAGLDVGLGFFPPTTGPAACDGSNCGVPAVPIAPLPGNASALTSAMQSATPPNSILTPNLTPTECGLRGMVSTCVAHMAQTGEQCVGIFVTDGQPTECNTDTNALIQLATDGLAQGVKIFVLGMSGSNFAFLDPLAQAGGTDCSPNGAGYACDLTSGGSSFSDALNAIRSSVVTTVTQEVVQQTTLDCTWAIPAPDQGDTLDPDKVNVDFTADNVATQSIGRVPSQAECANYQGGWYYDDASAPTTISVCDDTCNVIKTASHPRIDIKLGCVTEYSPPR
jgi:hypothetical protein